MSADRPPDERWEWEQYEHSGAYLGGPGQYLKPRKPRPPRREIAWENLVWWGIGLGFVAWAVLMWIVGQYFAAHMHIGG